MPSIVNVAAQALQRRIIDGEFPAGSALPSQRELAEQLSISRASLREAISTLEALGLVRSQPSKGVFVTTGKQPDPRELPRGTASMTPQALFEFRAVLEPAWTALAARRLDAAGRERLDAIQRGMEDALKVCDLVIASDYDLQFHLCLAEFSGNAGLAAVAAQFRDPIGHSLRLPFSNPAGIWDPADEHRQILAAVIKGDAAGAEAAMRAHLSAAAKRVGLSSPFL